MNKDWTEDWAKADLDERFELLDREYSGALYEAAQSVFRTCYGGRFANVSSMNYQWAQDAVQDGLMRAYVYLKEHPDHIIRFPKAWHCALIKREAMRIVKKFYFAYLEHLYSPAKPPSWQELPSPEELELFLKKYQDALTEDQRYDIQELIAASERASELYEIMDTILPKEQKEALEAFYFDDLQYEEMAQKFGVPVGTLKSRVSRGIFTLTREYERRREDEGC